MNSLLTDEVLNWIDNEPTQAISGKTFDDLNPATGKPIAKVTRSLKEDVDIAVASAKGAQAQWASMTPVARADILREVAIGLRRWRHEMTEVVATETGKSTSGALGETMAAVEQGFFMAGEGRRLYGRTTTSAMPERTSISLRRPVGLAGLIIASNTPIANVAWKVFPALVCGNTAVLKPSEDSSMVAYAFAQIAKEAGLPPGVLNIVNGFGQEAGAPLVEHGDVDLISFTGSTNTGKWVAEAGAKRLAKTFLELGGKNPLVVCDDADFDNAVKWVLLSAFSNAGQRCASGSRIIIFESIYDKFKEKVLKATTGLKVGVGDNDDFGPVINERQLNNMLSVIKGAVDGGATLLTGGNRLSGGDYGDGFYIAPTMLENIDHESEIAQKELFGPIACLFKVSGFKEALELSNNSSYGLTACIHTSSVTRAMDYCLKVEAGSANVNVGTFGSEPHMGFGGVKNSGNGLREPGTEALDVYCEWKNININIIPDAL